MNGKPMIDTSEAELRTRLTPEQYRITREKGTERPFCGTLLDNKLTGVYSCICCGLPLFASNAKFDSGTGWPSFFKPASDEAVETEQDDSLFVQRTEVHCRRCGSHLGHLFDDGPRPTGLRYCVNSASLKFSTGQGSGGEG